MRSTLWMAYRPYWKQGVGYILLGFFGRLLFLSQASLVGFWVDLYSTDPAAAERIPAFLVHFESKDFLGLLLTLSSLGFLLTWLFRIGFSRISAFAVSRLYDETTYRVSRFPMAFFDHQPAGRVITRFSSDYGNVFRLFGGPLAEFLSIVFDLVSMLTLILYSSIYYAPFLVAISVTYWLVFKWNQPAIRERRRKLSASRSPSVAHFAETTQGASVIRSFQRENSFTQRFFKMNAFFLKNKQLAVNQVLLFSLEMNFLTAVLLFSTGVMAFFLLRNGALTLGSVGVVFGFIALSGNTVQMFFEWMNQFEEALVGVERLDQYLRMSIEPGARIPSASVFATGHWQETKDIAKIEKPPACSVEFKNVWFRYGPEFPFVLKDFSLKIEAGEKVGIIGKTGSGKSSLIQSLLYLYPIDRGQISVGGISPQLRPDALDPSRVVSLKEYRSFFSYIPQDPSLLSGTLHENLDPMFLHPTAKILKILQISGLKKWANPEGLAKIIEERGKNLSLGEKQLLCLARCLLQDSPVVIMDEATSAIDPQTEEIMVKLTSEFLAQKSQILIAHRLSTLEKCDRIVWIDQGKILEMASPTILLKKFKTFSTAALESVLLP